LLGVLQENLDKCGLYTEKLYGHLRKNGFSPENTYLRINDFDHFEAIVCVPEENFVDHRFLEMYRYTSRLEGDAKDRFFVEFSFLGFEDGYNRGAMESDGYALKYGRENHEA